MAHDVFISYSSQDKAVAEAVCAILERRGIRCWIAPRDVPAGRFSGNKDAISRSRFMLLLVSAASNKSEHCINDVHTAFDHNVRVIPLVIDKTSVSEDMEFYLSKSRFLKTPAEFNEKNLKMLTDEIIKDREFKEMGEEAEEAAREKAKWEEKAARARQEAEEAKKAFEETQQAVHAAIGRRPEAAAGKAKMHVLPTFKNRASGKGEARQEISNTAPTALMPGDRADLVHFSITSPPTVQRDSYFMLSIWAHLEKQRKEVIQRAQQAAKQGKTNISSQGPVKIPSGTFLTVRVTMDDFIIEPHEATILWEGQIGNVTFGVKVPQNAKMGRRVGAATIHWNGFQLAIIFFEIHVGRKATSLKQIKAKLKHHRTAFASYASPDRDEVMKRIQGMQKVAPELDIFVDIDSLRSGQDWWQEIQKVIPSRDVFYLFWSGNAKASKWVEEEWRCALSKRGIHFIDPCPLVSPQVVPPPMELESLHFYDRWQAYQDRKTSNTN
jgi:hypothetical protein